MITLLAVSISHLRTQSVMQLELSFGLPDEKRRPGARRGIARWSADRAMDAVRKRFGRDAVGYAMAQFDRRRSVPDAFRVRPRIHEARPMRLTRVMMDAA
jgi:DNA polymerase-4